MKKTLALALVAAMTISMASMTAFAKTKYNSDSQVAEPEKVVAQVTYKKDDDKVVTETRYANYKLKTGVTAAEVNVTVTNNTVTAADYAKLDAATKDKLEPDETSASTVYKIKFSDIGLKKYDNTATKTFKGWHQDDAVGDLTTANNTNWTTEEECKVAVKGDDDMIELTDDTHGNLQAQFSTAGRIDNTDESIAKNLENIEKAKKDKDAKEANKKDLEKWDEEHNATNNVLKRGDDGKDVLDTAQAIVTPMGTKWQNRVAEYWGNDDYCRHAAQVIGLGDDAGDIYDIYAVESPSDPEKGIGFLKGKSARITLAPISIKKPGDFNITVYHVEGWCKAKKVKDFKIVDDKIVLWGDSFSPYVVVYEAKDAASAGSDASNPSTGDFSAVPVALLAAAALGATGFVAYKKRKAE